MSELSPKKLFCMQKTLQQVEAQKKKAANGYFFCKVDKAL